MSNQVGFRWTKTFTKQVLEGADYCEHCSIEDFSKAVGFHYERDSFGYVGAHIVCEPCHEAIEEAEGEEETTCHDCKQNFKVKDTIEWKWWDFYGPQGDEPYVVCKECRLKPTHIERVRKDREDYEAECDRNDDDDEEDFEGPDEDWDDDEGDFQEDEDCGDDHE